MNQTIKQHFIPQCYLKQWDCGNNSIILNDPINEVSYKRKIENVFFIKYLYSLYLENLDIIENKEDLTKCFKEYIVFFNEKQLSNFEILQNFNEFDNFIIKRNNHYISNKEKKDLKEKFNSTFSNEIEEAYSKIECKLQNILFSQDIYENLQKLEDYNRVEFHKMFYECANNFYIRNPYTFNFHLRRILNDDDFVKKNEKLFKHFQKNDRKFIPFCDLVFLINNTNIPFYTSDIPVALDLSLAYEIDNDLSYKSFFYFPLSPKLAVRFCYVYKNNGVKREFDGKFDYYVFNLSNVNQINIFNKKMIDNCSNFFVTNNMYYCKNGSSNFRFDFSKKNLRGIYKELL